MHKHLFFIFYLLVSYSAAFAQVLNTALLSDSLSKIEQELYTIDWDQENAQEQEEELLQALYLLANEGEKITDENLELADLYHKQFGRIFNISGRYLLAIEMYENARKLRRLTLGNTSELVHRMTKNIAACYYYLELYDQAIPYFDQAIIGYENLIDPSAPTYKKNLHRLGECFRFRGVSYSDIGEFQRAESDCFKAVQLFEQEENSNFKAKSYSSLSVVFIRMRKYVEAKSVSQKAVTIFMETDNQSDLANIYNNLGNVYDLSKDYEAAIRYYKKALDIDRKMDNLAYSGETFNNIGLVYLHKKQADSAKFYLLKALETTTKSKGNAPFHYDYAAVYENLGDLYSQEKNYDKALENYQLALINNTTNFRQKDVYKNPQLTAGKSGIVLYSKPDFLRILALKAQAFYAKKEPEAALTTFLLYDKAIDLLHRDLRQDDSRLTWIQRAHSVYETAISVALEAGETEQAFLFTERSKAVLLLRQLQDLEAKAQLPDSLIRAERTLRRQIGVATRELFDFEYANDHFGLNRTKEKLAQFETELEALNQYLEEQFPAYLKQKNSVQRPTITDIRKKALGQQTGLLEFFVGAENWTVFLLTQTNIQAREIPIDSVFMGNLQAFIAGIRSNKMDCPTFGFSHDIYQLFLAELLSESKEIKRLLIIPDGELAFLPFETLLRKPAPQPCNYDLDKVAYLLEDFSVYYAYSAAVLLDNLAAPNKKKRQDFLGLAPAFSSDEVATMRTCDQGTMSALAHNQTEIKTSSAFYKNAKILLGQSATKTDFLRHLANYRIVHLATHACQNSEDSRIFLAEEEVLGGEEIRSLPLQADLVLLSACETGTGKLHTGEGVMSLARNFAVAGSPSLMMSLWPVRDRATETIMVEVHRQLKNGLSKDEALRQAKLHYLQTEAFQLRPSHWAPFVLVGNPEPIYGSGFAWYWWLGGLVLVGLTVKIIFSLSRKVAKVRQTFSASPEAGDTQ